MLSHDMYTYTDVFHDNSQCKMLPAHCEVNTVDQGLNAIKGYKLYTTCKSKMQARWKMKNENFRLGVKDRVSINCTHCNLDF